MDGILQQVQKDRAPTQRMDMLDILQKDVEEQGGDFDRVYAALKQGIDSGKMRIMRHGNTLLIYSILEPGVADVHISTADSPQALVGAGFKFQFSKEISGLVEYTYFGTTVDGSELSLLSAGLQYHF